MAVARCVMASPLDRDLGAGEGRAIGSIQDPSREDDLRCRRAAGYCGDGGRDRQNHDRSANVGESHGAFLAYICVGPLVSSPP